MPNRCYTHQGQLIEQFTAAGLIQGKPRKDIIKLDEGLFELSDDEMREVYDWLAIYLLAAATPEERPEMLATLETCPCCDGWLGHNNPPADDGDSAYRQRSFNFD